MLKKNAWLLVLLFGLLMVWLASIRLLGWPLYLYAFLIWYFGLRLRFIFLICFLLGLWQDLLFSNLLGKTSLILSVLLIVLYLFLPGLRKKERFFN